MPALGSSAQGAGNRLGDGFDGAVQGSVVATYLHGPCLARNPVGGSAAVPVVGPLEPLELPEVDQLRRERLAAPRRVSPFSAPKPTLRSESASKTCHFVDFDTTAAHKCLSDPAKNRCLLDRGAAARERAPEGELVGELQIPTHRQA